MPPWSSVSPRVVRPFDQRRAPREAGAHPGHQHELARFQPSVLHRVGKRKWDRPGRRVAVAVDVHDHLLPRDAELLGRVIHDPDVRLVRDVDVDLLNRAPALVEDSLCGRNHYTGRELEHLAAVHLDERLGMIEVPRAATGQPEVLAPAAVGAQLETEESSLLHWLEHDGSRTVAEKDER